MSVEREFWYLEGFLDTSGRLWRTALPTLPLRIGRHPSCGLVLASDSVSSQHAELFAEGGDIWVRDLASRNGTYVNRARLQAPRALAEGDILHFADREFRLSRHRPRELGDTTRTGTLDARELSHLLEDRGRALAELLRQRTINSLFQPIRDLGSERTLGWELLSTGDLEGLHTPAEELFRIAAEVEQAAALSRLCREIGVSRVGKVPRRDPVANDPVLFVNTHPVELDDPATLIRSLSELRAQATNVRLVVEIHEASPAAVPTIMQLGSAMRELGIGLAFDDFGIGQSRLVELSALLPDYLKFAMPLIKGIDHAPREHVELVRSLVAMALSLGITPVAEGVETPAELAQCRELGFTAVQGFIFGQPAPAESITD